MGDHAATTPTVFPSQNDVAAVAGDGITGKERSFSDFLLAYLFPRNWVASGLTVPATDADLVIQVALGTAYIAGRRIDIAATNVTCADASTNYIFLKLARDGGNLINGVNLEVNVTGTAPADSVLLAKAVAAAGAITSTSDERPLAPVAHQSAGPSATGPSSSLLVNGTFSSTGNFNLSGVNCYRNFTLGAGHTLTVPDGGRAVVIIATGVITIAGTIDAEGAGGTGGVSGGGAADGSPGDPGTDQPGGGGGANVQNGGRGGAVLLHGCTLQAGGAGGAAAGGNGTAGTALATSNVLRLLHALSSLMGGGGGGGGNADTGGNGGGSIVLIAPTIVFSAGAVLNSKGSNGTAAGNGGGGGGGAGNIWVLAQSITDGGLSVQTSGGSGGVTAAGDGAAGATGVYGCLKM